MVVCKPVVASHPDYLAVAYSLSWADASIFTIDSEMGQVRVSEGTILDYKRDRNTYTVNVTATDTSGTGALIIATIEVTEINYGPYDRDNNERIDRDEALTAVSGYIRGLIDKDEVIRHIRLYFAR